MSSESGVRRTPVGPPWSVDDLADIHAGVYDAEITAALRARIADDPEGSAILAALDLTVDDLSLLPDLAMPEQYALRLDRAITAESLARTEARATGRTVPVVPFTFGPLLQGGGPARTDLPTAGRVPTRSTPRRPVGPPPRRTPL